MSISRITFYAVFLILFFTSAQAQITITKNDIAQARDTIRVSNANNINTFNYAVTDTNYFWDFSTLTYNTQRVEEYISIFRTGFTYNLFFADLPFNPNRANMAQETNLALPAIISSSESYNFFYRNDNAFEQVGIGTTLNGIETAIRFDDNDVIYRFPLQYGDVDTSDSEYDFNLAGFAYYHLQQSRINEVDGWGIIVTPLDTFQALRVKTTLIMRDSLYIDSLNFGFALPRPREVQYKWLALGRKIPVLQINTRSGFGSSFVTGAFYQDNAPIPVDTTGIFERKNITGSLKIYPNPARNQITAECVQCRVQSVSLIDVAGKIYRPQYVYADDKLTVQLQSFENRLVPGYYMLLIETDLKIMSATVIILP
jgi:hypothetical protein